MFPNEQGTFTIHNYEYVDGEFEIGDVIDIIDNSRTARNIVDTHNNTLIGLTDVYRQET